MSTEDLLKPRYRAIADYPGQAFKIGEIITDIYDTFSYCHKYPAIFEPIAWWEERNPEDMPKYVKKGLRFIMVNKWAFDSVRVDVMYFTWDGEDVGAYVDYPPYPQPATESEYNEYLKQSK